MCLLQREENFLLVHHGATETEKWLSAALSSRSTSLTLTGFVMLDGDKPQVLFEVKKTGDENLTRLEIVQTRDDWVKGESL